VRDHGVEERAGDLDPFPQQHAEIVFQVVADLQRGGVPDRFERSQNVGFGFRCDRDVAAGPGAGGEGESDDGGAVFVEAVGFEIEAERGRGGEFGDQRGAAVGVVGDAVCVFEVGECFQRHFGFGGGCGGVFGRRGFGEAREQVALGGGGVRGLGVAFLFADFGGLVAGAEQALADRVEFELVAERLQLRFVARLEFQFGERNAHRHVLVDGDQFEPAAGVVGVFLEAFFEFAFEVVGVREQVFQIAVFEHQFFRRLLADAGHAGNVVGRVAPERENVGDVDGGFHAPLFAHRGGVERFAAESLAGGFEHGDRGADQLGEIFVGRDHEGVVAAGLGGEPGVGADDVVGLVAGLGDSG